jgi:Recombinase
MKPNANGPGWLGVEDGKWVVDEARADTVRWIFQRAYAGRTAPEILHELAEQKIPPISDRARKGGKLKDMWEEKDIHTLLTNRLVCGTDVYPLVVHQEHFDAVQLMRDNSPGGQQRSPNLFAGMLFCATCAAKLRLRTYKKPFRRIIECPAGHTGKWNYEYLETLVIEQTFGNAMFVQTADIAPEIRASEAEKKALLIRQRLSGLVRRSIYRIEVGDGVVRVGRRRPTP